MLMANGSPEMLTFGTFPCGAFPSGIRAAGRTAAPEDAGAGARSAGARSDRYLKLINVGMDLMEKVLMDSLRTGDVISRYSGNQFIVMLPNCQYDSSQMIMKRIQNNFYSRDSRLRVKIRYSVDEIDFSRKAEAEV